MLDVDVQYKENCSYGFGYKFVIEKLPIQVHSGFFFKYRHNPP